MKQKLSKLLMLLCVIVFCYSGYQLISTLENYRLAQKEYEKISEEYLEIAEINAEEANQEKSTENAEYSIDFDALKQQNPDCVGWIILPESRINYPIVKSKNNEEYVSTTFDGQSSRSGAIFMDQSCEADFSSQNTVIYGHNMKDGSMFRALNEMTDESYFEKHHTFLIFTGEKFETFEVISCYQATTGLADCWQTDFESEEAYGQWLDTIEGRSLYQAAAADKQKSTVTLSTCRGSTGGNGRFLVYLQKVTDKIT